MSLGIDFAVEMMNRYGLLSIVLKCHFKLALQKWMTLATSPKKSRQDENRILWEGKWRKRQVKWRERRCEIGMVSHWLQRVRQKRLFFWCSGQNFCSFEKRLFSLQAVGGHIASYHLHLCLLNDRLRSYTDRVFSSDNTMEKTFPRRSFKNNHRLSDQFL